MVNTLKKVVLGALLGATLTVAFGAVSTFACDKADDPAEKWAEAREQMVENYKADLEEKIAEEKAAREAIQEEAEYKYDIQSRIKNDLTYSEVYVKAVADQSRGLNRDAIKDAKEYAQSWNDNALYWFNFNKQYKNWTDRNAAKTDAVEEAQPRIKEEKDGNEDAVKIAYKMAFGKDFTGWGKN